MESGRRIRRKPGSPLTQNPAACKAAREDAELKQQDVADQVGIAVSLLSEIENGSRSAQPLVLEALAAIYKADVDDLKHRPSTCVDGCKCTCHAQESA